LGEVVRELNPEILNFGSRHIPSLCAKSIRLAASNVA